MKNIIGLANVSEKITRLDRESQRISNIPNLTVYPIFYTASTRITGRPFHFES